jgi:hypothetical protein
MTQFYCIFKFPTDEFELEAVFTCEKDADAFILDHGLVTQESFTQQTLRDQKAWKVQMSLRHIKNAIIRECLGDLYIPLAKIAGIDLEKEDEA